MMARRAPLAPPDLHIPTPTLFMVLNRSIPMTNRNTLSLSSSMVIMPLRLRIIVLPTNTLALPTTTLMIFMMNIPAHSTMNTVHLMTNITTRLMVITLVLLTTAIPALLMMNIMRMFVLMMITTPSPRTIIHAPITVTLARLMMTHPMILCARRRLSTITTIRRQMIMRMGTNQGKTQMLTRLTLISRTRSTFRSHHRSTLLLYSSLHVRSS
ncbi:hypothetical protein BJV74DRAFT_859547 [Russula compacta]|nr:hypothetical protein BJV74DRAFT_859547 [Russula compacta]